jgi:hypothetical protein
MLVPTGILGDDILYGGGLVQVVYSTCDSLNKMLGYINSADLVPEPLFSYQKLLLRNHSRSFSPTHSNTIPMQFLPLCIGNPHSGKLSIDYYRRSNPLGEAAPFQFILPINAVKRSIQQAKKNGETFVVKLADAGTSSSRIQPVYEEGITQLVVLEDNGACSIEYSLWNHTEDAMEHCVNNTLAQLLLQDDARSWQNYFVHKFLIPYPQIVGELEEVCMS